MPAAVAALLGSKKFLFTAVVSVLVFLGGHYGLMDQSLVHQLLMLLLPSYVVAQGLADHGKASAAIENEGYLKNTETRASMMQDLCKVFTEALPHLAAMSTPPKVGSSGLPRIDQDEPDTKP